MKKIILLLLTIFIGTQSFAKDTLTIGMRLEPPHLDPTASSAAAIDEIVYNNVFEGLFRIVENGNIERSLATDYIISVDGKTYTIPLKKNVYFHNGDKLTADDVVFSISRIYAKDSINPRKKLFNNIKSVSKKNSNTVIIKLHKPSHTLIYNLALPDAVIFNRNNYLDNKNNPVGTGAFVFDEMKKGYFVKLKRNRNYHDKFSKLKSIKFRFISDGLSASSAILSGEVDGFPFYQDVMTLKAFKSDKFKVITGSTEGEVLVALNHRHKFLKDKKVRQALTHAIDKQALINIVAPNATPIGSHYPPHREHYVDYSNKYPYNPKLAKKMLKQAGAENMELEFTVPPSYKLKADVIAGYLRNVGVKVKMKQVDWGTWLSQSFKKYKYDITIVSHVEPKDYDIYANPKYYFGYDNKLYQHVIRSLKMETVASKHINLLKQAQRILADDAVNIWLYQSPKIGVWNKNIYGFWKNAPVEGNVLKDVYWK